MIEQDGSPGNLWLQQVYLRGGWMRQLPPAAIGILGPLVDGPMTVDEIEVDLRRSSEGAEGWASAAWEPLRQWTDEELAELRADSPMGPAEDDGDAQTVMAQEAAGRAERLAAIDRYSGELGVSPVRTLGDLLEFMIACRLISRAGAGGAAQLDLDPGAPLPGEVLSLPAAEQAEEDELRWRQAHEHTAQAIIRLFTPNTGDGPDRLRTTLQRLARQLDTDVESVRAGALGLLSDGDFTASRDLERVLEHQVFELTVDRDAFARGRMHIRRARPEELDG